MIPYGRQDITQQDIDNVVTVLQSDYLTQGPVLPQFEERIANYCKSKFAIAVNSATSALHISCLALDLQVGDYLWTSPITFVASANCGIYCGAKIDFVDIDPRTYNICVIALKEKLIAAEKRGLLPKILIVVHMAGRPCDLKSIRKLADEYNFKIIEDASHAIGAKYYGEPIGNSSYSDITVFSFHPVKIITTGEGGVAVTNNESYAKKMMLLRSHGVTRNKAEMQNNLNQDWYYEQVSIGFNYRMTDIQAALGLSQLSRLDHYLELRNNLAHVYDKYLKDIPIKLPVFSKDIRSAWHLYVIQVESSGNHIDRDHLYNRLRLSGIGVNVHYIPIYKHPFYERLGFRSDYCPNAEVYYKNALSLPLYPGLMSDQQHHIISAIREFMK